MSRKKSEEVVIDRTDTQEQPEPQGNGALITDPAQMEPLVASDNPLIPARGTSLASCPTNIDTTTPDGKALLFNGTGEPDYPFGRGGEVEINVVHYLVHRATVVDPETGETAEAVRTVFFDDSGRTAVTFSEVVPDRLAKLMQMFGPGPWRPGIRVILIERRARRSGRTYHDIRLRLGSD